MRSSVESIIGSTPPASIEMATISMLILCGVEKHAIISHERTKKRKSRIIAAMRRSTPPKTAIATAEIMEETYSRFGACPMAQRISSNAAKPQMMAMITPNSQMGAKNTPPMRTGMPTAAVNTLFFTLSLPRTDGRGAGTPQRLRQYLSLRNPARAHR